MTTARGTPRRYLEGVTLDNPQARYLLGLELPEIPEELLDADTYLLSIAVAKLLDGQARLDSQETPDEPR